MTLAVAVTVAGVAAHAERFHASSSMGASSTVGSAMVSEENSGQGGTLAVRMKQPSRCDRRRPTILSSVVDRRAATWRWQDLAETPRTKTAHRARHSRSCGYLRWVARLWAGRADHAYRFWRRLERDAPFAICHVFRGRYCREALSVTWCESKHDVTAGVGKHQYLGLFQMGSSERARYGHGWTAIEQVRAAYRYFVASGRDWSPWQCRPGGLAW